MDGQRSQWRIVFDCMKVKFKILFKVYENLKCLKCKILFDKDIKIALLCYNPSGIPDWPAEWRWSASLWTESNIISMSC